MTKWSSWLLALAVVFAGACGDDDGGGDPGPTGELRIWHLAAEAGDVDVFVNGEPFLEGFAFEDVTGFEELDAGTYDVAIAPAGMGIGAAVLTVDGFALGEGERWTVAAIQVNEDPQAAGAFAVLPIEESATPPAAGSIRLRAFHAAFAVPQAVDVYEATTPLLVFENVAQGAASGQAEDVPNGAYTLGLDVDRDGAIDLQTEMPLDMPVDQASILVGVISKPEDGDVETEVVYVVNEGLHDEVGLVAIPE